MASFMRGIYQRPNALRQEYRAGGRAAGSPYDAKRGWQNIEERDRSFAEDVQSLTSRLQSLINNYGQSENVSDREMANIYAGYLRDLSKGGEDTYRIVNQYRKGYLPGLGRSGGETAPAWS